MTRAGAPARDPDDALARALAMAETPEECAAVGAALAGYYAERCCRRAPLAEPAERRPAPLTSNA